MTDRKGVVERPDSATMQKAVDALRGLLKGDADARTIHLTVAMAADMMELQIDWLMEQHRVIETLTRDMG